MRLQIDEEDSSLDNDNDSVFSGSTNVTESRASSRRNSKDDILASGRNSLESQEVGYGSDRENSDPKFAMPGSKLKAPKIYPASSSVVATRSRSSSRNRNALGSAN